MRFIEENADRPFCLYIAHEAPHYPYQGREDEPIRSPGKVGKEKRTGADAEAAYKEMVEVMDEGVGRVISTLERLDLTRDTFVFFFSDNGATGLGSNGIYRGHKGSLWEGGHRVPAIAYQPGLVPAGGVCDEPALSIDVFPTILGLAGASVPDGHQIDGVDLTPAMRDGRSLSERTLFWGHGQQRAARRGLWKLITGAKDLDDGPGLYNLDDDPSETANIADQHPRVVQELQSALVAWEDDVTSGVEQQT